MENRRLFLVTAERQKIWTTAMRSVTLLILIVATPVLAAADITVTGDTGELVEFGTAVLAETKFKTNFQEGKLTLPDLKPGSYHLRLTAPGREIVETEIKFPLPGKFTVAMPLQTRRTQKVRLITHEERHNVSRHQLQQHELKSVPATFGDSVSALATLPGVNRPGGIFGPLVIRGAPDTSNRYFIDDIPVINPQHFGGFQSVISNELIEDITLFSSAFPATYGQALGAIIDIRTIEAMNKKQIVLQTGIISSNAFFAAPWSIFSPKPPEPGEKATPEEKALALEAKRKADVDTGFFSISGRVGYLSLLVPPIYKLITHKELVAVPEYYDYQWKSRWYLGDQNRHALTVMVFGSYDTFTLVRKLNDDEKKKRAEQGLDPQGGDITVFSDISSHSQGLYYDYLQSQNVKLRTMVFNTLIYSRFYREAPANSLGIIDVNTRPNISGFREIFDLKYLDGFGRLKLGGDYQFFHFNSSGVTQQVKATVPQGQADFNNPNDFDIISVSATGENHLISLFAENRFEHKGFFITPGIRSDYLSRSREATFNYRGLIGYKFPTNTTLAFSGGLYSSFAQTNWYRFNQASRREARITTADYIASEKATHRSVALEQEFGMHVFKVEGFYNNLYDLIQNTDSTLQAQGIFYDNSGGSVNRGIEVSYRKSLMENEDGFFGWVSYTFTRADTITATETYPFRYEQRHSVKLIGVLRWGANEIGARFTLYTGFPYTPITGSTCSAGYTCTDPASERYTAITSASTNSANYPLAHRLDLRYTRKSNFSWGTFSWYIECINLYNFEPLIRQSFDSTKPYAAGSNPQLLGPNTPINLIPNFGLEWKF